MALKCSDRFADLFPVLQTIFVSNLHRAELKVTHLRWRSPICGFLRFSAKICGFLRFPAPSKCWNLQHLGWICENLRFSAKICVLGFLCHLSSVTLSSTLITIRVLQKEVGKRSSITFFRFRDSFGHFLVTFSDAFRERQKHIKKKTRKQNFHGIVPGFWGEFCLCVFSPP